MQRPLPAPSTLTSSALDLSPMTPSPVTHQLPSLQPSLINATSSHLTAVTAPPSTHQLPPLQPSLTSLDMAAHALTSHHALEGTLDLVGVEGDSSNTQDVPADFEPGQRLSHLKHHMKVICCWLSFQWFCYFFFHIPSFITVIKFYFHCAINNFVYNFLTCCSRFIWKNWILETQKKMGWCFPLSHKTWEKHRGRSLLNSSTLVNSVEKYSKELSGWRYNFLIDTPLDKHFFDRFWWWLLICKVLVFLK